MALIASGLGVSGCSPATVLNWTVPTGHITVVRDVVYAEHPERTLDIYVPAKPAETAPVVVYFYGGAWQAGSKDDYLFVGEALSGRGFVVVVPDYRTFPAVRFPEFLADAARAVRHVFDTAPRFGGNERAVFLMGHSAGAHIATMLALDGRYLAEAGVDRTRLAGVIGLAGPYDFLPITAPDLRDVFAAAAGRMEITQPIHFVDAGAPPMLLLTGAADDTVYPRNTYNLARALGDVGVPADVKTYGPLGHIGIVSALAGLFRHRAPVLDDITAFIHRHSGRAALAEAGRAAR